MDSFGKRFKQERINKNLTQEELASNFHLKKSSISRYENNKQMPEIQLLQKFADFFGVTTDYLLNGIVENSSAVKEGYSTDTKKAAELFSSLNDKHKNIVLDLIEELLSNTDKKS